MYDFSDPEVDRSFLHAKYARSKTADINIPNIVLMID
jgi:hypothetical protein